MGWTLNLVHEFEFEGVPTHVARDGNNAAWICPDCRRPVLFVYSEGKVGSRADRGTDFCPHHFYLDPPWSPQPPQGDSRPPAEIMIIRRTPSPRPKR